MRLQEIERLCRTTLDDLAIPTGTTMGDFLDLLRERRKRPLTVQTFPSETGPCGVWMAGRTADLIFLSSDAVGVRRVHTLAHELSHVVLGHDQGDEVADPELLRQLFPDIDRVCCTNR